MKRLACSLAAGGIALFLMWLAGVDLDRRGADTLIAALVSLWSAGFVYFCFGWE